MKMEQILLYEIEQIPKPGINKLINQVNKYWQGHLPSTAQLQRFKSYIHHHNLEDIKRFQERYQTEIPGNPWGQKNNQLGNQSLASLFLDQVINSLTEINTLDRTSTVWEADFQSLFDGGNFAPLALNDKIKLRLTRKILMDIIDLLLLGQDMKIFYNDNGQLEVL